VIDARRFTFPDHHNSAWELESLADSGNRLPSKQMPRTRDATQARGWSDEDAPWIRPMNTPAPFGA
jgi:hypothetical protein